MIEYFVMIVMRVKGAFLYSYMLLQMTTVLVMEATLPILFFDEVKTEF